MSRVRTSRRADSSATIASYFWRWASPTIRACSSASLVNVRARSSASSTRWRALSWAAVTVSSAVRWARRSVWRSTLSISLAVEPSASSPAIFSWS